jgi:hypothetical protein
MGTKIANVNFTAARASTLLTSEFPAVNVIARFKRSNKIILLQFANDQS